MRELEVCENVELAPLTTFQIGGKARYFVEVSDERALRAAVAWAGERREKLFVLAGGSNVLIGDCGFDGLIIKIAMAERSWDGARVTVGAGAVLLDVIEEAAQRGLGGWESMAGIPGTVGGAVRGNAGAFGTEVKDVLVSAQAFNSATGEVRTFDNAACQFDYRQSFFKKNPTWIILSATFSLAQSDRDRVITEIEETIAERENRHLQNVRAAGSFFMNPQVPQDVQEMFFRDKGIKSRAGRVPAGWLIEEVGMRGKQIGGAQSSPQHPNYIINASGKATAEEVIMLASIIKMHVRDTLGVQLHEEVTMVGL